MTQPALSDPLQDEHVPAIDDVAHDDISNGHVPTTRATLLSMTYDDALEAFLGTRASFGGGLSNHGPMASEALVDMGAEAWTGRFVETYLPRLDRRDPPLPQRHGTGTLETDAIEVDALLDVQLPGLVDAAAAAAGHGLLRVAHAVRGIERGRRDGAVPAVRTAELAVALRYWRASGPSLPVAEPVAGDLTPDAWVNELRRLATFDPLPGLLTATLDLAAHQEGFSAIVSSLAPADDPADSLDALALAAADGFLRNDEFLSGFALLHGVTVSTMARVLLAHLEPADGHRLVTSVAAFVAAAIVGFDRPVAEPAPLLPVSGDLANRAAATLDDHTIKFTNACLGLAERLGSDLPLRAAELQIRQTS